jgi:hypothetical protein
LLAAIEAARDETACALDERIAHFGPENEHFGFCRILPPLATSSCYDEVVLKTIDQHHLDQLCPELRQVFDAEIAAGNHTVETRDGWPNKGALFVMLGDPFHGDFTASDSVLFYTETTPRGWKAHFCHLESKQILACGFGEGGRAGETAARAPNRTPSR